jgi:hypothetical protein
VAFQRKFKFAHQEKWAAIAKQTTIPASHTGIMAKPEEENQ